MRTGTQLLTMVVVGAAILSVLVLAGLGRQDSKVSPLAAQTACIDAVRELTSSRNAAEAAGAMAVASVRMDHAAVDYPQLEYVALAMKHASQEVASGTPNGYWGKALLRECRSLG
jgi:hypothetical protein